MKLDKKYKYTAMFVVVVFGLFLISGCSNGVIGQRHLADTDEVTYEGILEMLRDNTFGPSIVVLPNSGYYTTCAEICGNNDNSYCIYSEGKVTTEPFPERYPITCQSEIYVRSDNPNIPVPSDVIDDFRCMCALPPE